MSAFPPVASPYLVAREAQAYLRLNSPSALYRLIYEHDLPVCRAGGRYRFDVRELDAWMHGHASALEETRSRRRSA